MLFCSSPAEKAYEVGASNGDAGLEGGQDQLGLVGKDNSIFVAALKEHLQAERGSLKDTVQSLLNATAKSTFSGNENVKYLTLENCSFFRCLQT